MNNAIRQQYFDKTQKQVKTHHVFGALAFDANYVEYLEKTILKLQGNIKVKCTSCGWTGKQENCTNGGVSSCTECGSGKLIFNEKKQ